MIAGNNYTFESPEARAKLNRALAIISGPFGEGKGVRMREIAAKLGCNANTANTYCAELRARGLVHMQRTGNKVLWIAGKDPEPPLERVPSKQCHMPKQTTVSTWEPHHVRDPLDALLFGPGPGQTERRSEPRQD